MLLCTSRPFPQASSAARHPRKGQDDDRGTGPGTTVSNLVSSSSSSSSSSFVSWHRQHSPQFPAASASVERSPEFLKWKTQSFFSNVYCKQHNHIYIHTYNYIILYIYMYIYTGRNYTTTTAPLALSTRYSRKLRKSQTKACLPVSQCNCNSELWLQLRLWLWLWINRNEKLIRPGQVSNHVNLGPEARIKQKRIQIFNIDSRVAAAMFDIIPIGIIWILSNPTPSNKLRFVPESPENRQAISSFNWRT